MCANDLVLPINRVDAAVVTELLTNVLPPKVVTAILDGVFDAIRDSTAPTNVAALKRELGGLTRKSQTSPTPSKLCAAIAPLLKKLHDRQAEREALLAPIAAAEGADKAVPNRQAIERKVQATIKA